MWFAEVKAKAKRKNQILFSKDSLLLTDLCQLIAQANRRALILWALELAEETTRELAENIRKTTVLGKQSPHPEHGLPVRSKCPSPSGQS